MELGGAERSLIGLLRSIDYSRCDVDLFLCRHTGELMEAIPPQVNLLPEQPAAAAIAKPICSLLKSPRTWGIAVARMFAKLFSASYNALHKCQGDNIVEINCIHKFCQPFLPRIEKNKVYDLAVSFLAPHYLGVNKVYAKKRAAWIHTDYKNVAINVKSERKIWSRYDYVASVSEQCTKSFREVFGDLGNQLIGFENILEPSVVRSDAEKPIELSIPDGSISLCSVGRFAYPKNFDTVPAICRSLIERGFPVRWYIIGFGPDEPLIRQKIAEEKMEEHVILLGKKDNPYPYIKACQIYVQPSRYEGKAVTVREAQILGKPVVITAFQTAQAQLTDGYDGIIVPMDAQGCADGIASLLNDVDLQERLSHNCLRNDYGNQKEIEKLYRFME